MTLGPENLLSLDTPRLVFTAPGIEVYEANGPDGGKYGEIIAKPGEALATDLQYAIEHFHGNSRLRDVFKDEDDDSICINFWRDAA